MRRVWLVGKLNSALTPISSQEEINGFNVSCLSPSDVINSQLLAFSFLTQSLIEKAVPSSFTYFKLFKYVANTDLIETAVFSILSDISVSASVPFKYF